MRVVYFFDDSHKLLDLSLSFLIDRLEVLDLSISLSFFVHRLEVLDLSVVVLIGLRYWIYQCHFLLIGLRYWIYHCCGRLELLGLSLSFLVGGFGYWIYHCHFLLEA